MKCMWHIFVILLKRFNTKNIYFLTCFKSSVYCRWFAVGWAWGWGGLSSWLSSIFILLCCSFEIGVPALGYKLKHTNLDSPVILISLQKLPLVTWVYYCSHSHLYWMYQSNHNTFFYALTHAEVSNDHFQNNQDVFRIANSTLDRHVFTLPWHSYSTALLLKLVWLNDCTIGACDQ